MTDESISKHPARTPESPPRASTPQAPPRAPEPARTREPYRPAVGWSPSHYSQPSSTPRSRYRPPKPSWSDRFASWRARRAIEARETTRRQPAPPRHAPTPTPVVTPPVPLVPAAGKAPVPAQPERETAADRARVAGLVVHDQVALPAMTSWQDFLARATAADTTGLGHSRLGDDEGWAGASWIEAVRLATDGWVTHVPEVDVAVADLRSRMSDSARVSTLVQVADVCGSEVDVAAFLDGVPECMVETRVRQLSAQGRVVTFMVPASYSSGADHAAIINRGKALCALCVAIVSAGHSVEVWSGFASRSPDLDARCSAVARVISAGEPFDPSRLMFAMAHPAMLRRLWFGVWDSAAPLIADAMQAAQYGKGPFTCSATDLPGDIGDAYVFPYLSDGDRSWANWDSALSWSLATFADLGLLAHTDLT